MKNKKEMIINEIINNLSNDSDVKLINARININQTDPNQVYSLVTGRYYHHTLKSELLTDGDIESSEYLKSDLNDCFLDPTNTNRVIRLSENTIEKIKIENAKYVIIQGMRDESLKNINIFTEIEDLDFLKKIIEISSKVYKKDNCPLIEDKPYVRKLVLK